LFVNDPEVGYRMRPNTTAAHINTNAFGFNDIERAVKGPNPRIAVIGDSFVFGAVPREKNIASALQELAGESGIAVDVLNMGLPAAGPRNYLGLLQKDAAGMNVGMVCVVFFVGNDIVQSHPDFKTVVWLGSTREVLRRPYLLGLSKEYSYVYRAGRSVTRQIRERLDKTPRPAFARDTFLSIEYQRSEIHKKDRGAFLRECYIEAVNVLVEIAEKAEKLDMKCIIVLAPDQLQVSKELRASLARAYGMDMGDYDFKAPQKYITAELRKNGITVVDLLPAFEAAAQNDVLYLKQDTHWNEAGNLLAAEIIWDALGN
jgi:hypothetical protein